MHGYPSCSVVVVVWGMVMTFDLTSSWTILRRQHHPSSMLWFIVRWSTQTLHTHCWGPWSGSPAVQDQPRHFNSLDDQPLTNKSTTNMCVVAVVLLVEVRNGWHCSGPLTSTMLKFFLTLREGSKHPLPTSVAYGVAGVRLTGHCPISLCSGLIGQYSKGSSRYARTTM